MIQTLIYPLDLEAVTLKNRFVLVDNDADQIVFFETDGTVIGSLGFSLSSVSTNWQAAFFHDGYIHVLDDTGNRVYVYDVYGEEQTARRIDVGTGNWDGGFAYDDVIYIVAGANVKAFDPDDGSELTGMSFDLVSGDNGNGGYEYNGNFYIVLGFPFRVRVFNPSAVEQTALTFNLPIGAWRGGFEFQGNNYLIDDDEMRVFDPDGTEQTSGFDLPDGDFRGGFRLSSAAIAPKWSTIPDQDFDTSTAVDLDLMDYLSGDTGFTFTVTGLPSGLTLSAEGSLSGTPEAAGENTVTVTAENDAGSASTTFMITSVANVPEWSTIPDQDFSITSVVDLNLTDYLLGDTGFTFTVTGLPGGLALSSDGVLSGTPDAAGEDTVTVTAENDAGSASTTFMITVTTTLTRFYLTGFDSDRLRVFPPSGTEDTTLRIDLGTGRWQGGFEYNGNFYLVDNNSDRLRVFPPSGTEDTTLQVDLPSSGWTGGFEYNGNFYLTDTDTDRLRVFAPSGTENTALRIDLGEGAWNGGFEYNGNFYLTDNTSNRLHVFAPSGTENTALRIDLGTGSWSGGFVFTS